MLGPSSISTDWPDPTVYRQYPVNPVALLPGFRVKILNLRFSGVVVVVRERVGMGRDTRKCRKQIEATQFRSLRAQVPTRCFSWLFSHN